MSTPAVKAPERTAGGKWLRAYGFAFPALAYLAAGIWIVASSGYSLDPDGVGYIQAGKHWASGTFHLAINGVWSPLLSWLIVPLLWCHVEPTLAIGVIKLLSGLLFAAGCVALWAALCGGAGRLVIFSAALLLALGMLPGGLMPDMLLACILTWYFVASTWLLRKGTLSAGLACGLLGGFAYLAKGYAFPFVGVHLGLTLLARIWLVRKAESEGNKRILRPFAAAAAGFLAVCLPWIAVLSRHEGTPTFSRSGYVTICCNSPVWNQQFSGPWGLVRPKDGRLTTWENPLEAPLEWPKNPRMINLAGGLKLNLKKVLLSMKSIDVAGLLWCGWMVSIIFLFPLRESLARRNGILQTWACLTPGAYVAGFVLLFVDSRYLWPLYGMLLVLCVSSLGVRAVGTASRRIRLGFALLLFCGILVNVVNVVATVLPWPSWVGEARWVPSTVHSPQSTTLQRPYHGLMASNDWARGMFAAYWTDSVYIGGIQGATADDVVRELEPFGDTCLLVFNDDRLAQELARDQRFACIDHSANEKAKMTLTVFTVHPKPVSGIPPQRPG